MLCEQALDVESADLCSNCTAMAERLSYLVEYHGEKAGIFLTEKLNEITERRNRMFDRRKNQYQPPLGPHTPDRRVKNRRIRQVPNSPKRRKSDLV